MLSPLPGHKALMGSMGLAALCIRKHVNVRQVRSGGTGVGSAHPFPSSRSILGDSSSARRTWSESPRCGPVKTGSTRQRLDRIHEREMQLAAKTCGRPAANRGVRLYCCDNLDHHLSTILMNLEGVDPGDIGVMLRRGSQHRDLHRDLLHCAPLVHAQLGTTARDGGVRFSIGAFNTAQQVDAAIAGVADVARWVHERAAKSRKRVRERSEAQPRLWSVSSTQRCTEVWLWQT